MKWVWICCIGLSGFATAQTIEQETLPDLSSEVLPQGVVPAVEEETDLEVLQTPSIEAKPAQIAEMRALDKLTGQLETFDVLVGATHRYERLEITLKSCQILPKTQDATMFVDIRDDKIAGRSVFTGWMFAANPALSAVDHPRYDVWLLSCKTSSGETDS